MLGGPHRRGWVLSISVFGFSNENQNNNNSRKTETERTLIFPQIITWTPTVQDSWGSCVMLWTQAPSSQFAALPTYHVLTPSSHSHQQEGCKEPVPGYIAALSFKEGWECFVFSHKSSSISGVLWPPESEENGCWGIGHTLSHRGIIWAEPGWMDRI